MYNHGYGVTQDYIEAVKWYRIAAEQGNAHAQGLLGVAYGLGRGVPKDYIQSYMWLNVAAAQGNEKAGVIRDTLDNVMMPADVSDAQRRAREWGEAHQ